MNKSALKSDLKKSFIIQVRKPVLEILLVTWA